MSSSGAWHTETTEYLRHFSVRDCLQQALWRDVSAPLPGWAYLWADWQEFPVRVVFPTRRDRRWGELLTARRWGELYGRVPCSVGSSFRYRATGLFHHRHTDL